MELIVPDEKLSLAIGKKGQNVRLASQLTGWRIDIHSETKVREMEQRARQSLAAIKGDGGDGGAGGAALAEALFAAGWRSAAEVASAKPDELASVPAVGGVEQAKVLISSAALAAEGERVREAARIAQENAARAESQDGGGESTSAAPSPEAR
jgi:N utilization substance protein A